MSRYQIDEYTLQFSVYVPDGSLAGETARPYEEDTEIDPLDFALQLDGTTSRIARAERAAKGLKFSWLAEAHACSPATYRIPTQRLTNYQIISTGSFGEDFPAGTDIKNLFIEEYRDAPSADWIAHLVDDTISDDDIPAIHQRLRLATAPVDADHRFTVTLELDDGSYYEFVSPRVSFDLEESNPE